MEEALVTRLKPQPERKRRDVKQTCLKEGVKGEKGKE